jgi:hypothetical protein
VQSGQGDFFPNGVVNGARLEQVLAPADRNAGGSFDGFDLARPLAGRGPSAN